MAEDLDSDRPPEPPPPEPRLNLRRPRRSRGPAVADEGLGGVVAPVRARAPRSSSPTPATRLPTRSPPTSPPPSRPPSRPPSPPRSLPPPEPPPHASGGGAHRGSRAAALQPGGPPPSPPRGRPASPPSPRPPSPPPKPAPASPAGSSGRSCATTVAPPGSAGESLLTGPASPLDGATPLPPEPPLPALGLSSAHACRMSGYDPRDAAHMQPSGVAVLPEGGGRRSDERGARGDVSQRQHLHSGPPKPLVPRWSVSGSPAPKLGVPNATGLQPPRPLSPFRPSEAADFSGMNAAVPGPAISRAPPNTNLSKGLTPPMPLQVPSHSSSSSETASTSTRHFPGRANSYAWGPNAKAGEPGYAVPVAGQCLPPTRHWSYGGSSVGLRPARSLTPSPRPGGSPYGGRLGVSPRAVPLRIHSAATFPAAGGRPTSPLRAIGVAPRTAGLRAEGVREAHGGWSPSRGRGVDEAGGAHVLSAGNAQVTQDLACYVAPGWYWTPSVESRQERTASPQGWAFRSNSCSGGVPHGAACYPASREASPVPSTRVAPAAASPGPAHRNVYANTPMRSPGLIMQRTPSPMMGGSRLPRSSSRCKSSPLRAAWAPAAALPVRGASASPLESPRWTIPERRDCPGLLPFPPLQDCDGRGPAAWVASGLSREDFAGEMGCNGRPVGLRYWEQCASRRRASEEAAALAAALSAE